MNNRVSITPGFVCIKHCIVRARVSAMVEPTSPLLSSLQLCVELEKSHVSSQPDVATGVSAP